MMPIISGGNDAFEKSFISVSILSEEVIVALPKLAATSPELLMARGHQADVENRNPITA